MTEKTKNELRSISIFFGYDAIGYIRLQRLLDELEEIEEKNPKAKNGMDAFHEVFRMISLCANDKSLY